MPVESAAGRCRRSRFSCLYGRRRENDRFGREVPSVPFYAHGREPRRGGAHFDVQKIAKSTALARKFA